MSLIARLLLVPVDGFAVDLNTFSSWFREAAEGGVIGFYDRIWADYPPLNVYLFWFLGSVERLLSPFGSLLVLKIAPNLFDLATSYLIYGFLRKRAGEKKALAASVFYAFNPATIFNSSVWGQYDAIYTSLAVLSLLMVLERKPRLSLTLLAASVLTKPQAVFIAPLVLFLIITRDGWVRLGSSLLVAATFTALVVLPVSPMRPIETLLRIYFGAYGTYAFNTVNAFNTWSLIGFWKPDTQTFLFLSLCLWGWLSFIALVALVVYRLRFIGTTDSNIVLHAALILSVGFFMLPTRIHERYLFPAFSLASLAETRRSAYGLLTISYLVNELVVLDVLNRSAYISDGDPIAYTIALVNIVIFIYLLTQFWKARG